MGDPQLVENGFIREAAAKLVDSPTIRIYEHERSCLWCAQNYPKICPRLEFLQLADRMQRAGN